MSIISLAPLGQNAPSDAEWLHKYVMSGFPGDGNRAAHHVLWRSTPQGILIRSDIAPNLPGIRTKEDILTSADTVLFTATINPITRKTVLDGARERRVENIGDPAEIVVRLLAPAALVEDIHQVVTRQTQRKGKPLTIAEVTGIAHVAVPDAIAALLREGIGRGRAYGCGMVTMLPA